MTKFFESNKRAVTAQFTSTCIVCRQTIEQGQAIKHTTVYAPVKAYTQSVKGWAHAGCADENDASIDKYLAQVQREQYRQLSINREA